MNRNSQLCVLSLVVFSVVFLCPTNSFAQWEWSVRGGSVNNLQNSSQYNDILGIETDPHGNVYLLGRIGGGGVKVDNQNLTAYSTVGTGASNDVVLSSFTSSGEYRWSKVIGGESSDFGYAIKMDLVGNVYVSGIIMNPVDNIVGLPNNAVHFDTDTILPKYPPSNPDTLRKQMYLIKYDTAGTYHWLSMPEPEGVTAVNSLLNNSFPIGLDIDSIGDVFWCCYLRPGQFGWASNNVISQEGLYVIKYNALGQKLDIVPLELNVGRGVELTGLYGGVTFFKRNHITGAYYVSGQNLAKDYTYMTIGGDTIASNMYLACFSPQGQLLWKHVSTGVDAGNIYGLSLDEMGNLYLTGEVRSGTVFGGNLYQSSNVNGSPFVTAFDPNGNLIWSVTGVSEGANTAGASIAIADTEVAITGRGFRLYWPGETDTIYTEYNAGYDAYIARFNKSDGSLIAMDRTHTSHGAGSYGNAIAAGPQNTYYMGGNFDAAMYLGQDTLYKVGSQRSFFLTKYTCDVPESNYSYTGVNDTNLVTFTYTGALADSVKWYLGDGTQVWGDTITHYYQTAGMYHVCAEAFFECTEATYCDTIYAGSIGVHEEERLGMVFYPNPTNGILHVENLEKGSTLYIYTLNGQALFETHVEGGDAELDIADFPLGVYLLVVESGGDWYYEKVVKE